MRFCVDCRHCEVRPEMAEKYQRRWFKRVLVEIPTGENRYLCKLASGERHEFRNPVTGLNEIIEPAEIDCGIERRYGDCGRDAVNWEPIR